MRIVGIGTDIVQISRIERIIEKHGAAFAKRILHENELKRFQENPHPKSYLAKRFAAKEAFSKAMGTGIAKGVNLQEIETLNDKQGKPEFILHGDTLKKSQEMGITHTYLSLSDETEYAVAYVLLSEA